MSLTQILEYNGVQLRDCTTLKHSEVPKLASDGSIIGFERSIRVLGYFTGDKGSLYPQLDTSIDPAGDKHPDRNYRLQASPQHYNFLRAFMLTPRRKFRFWTGAIPNQDPTDFAKDNGGNAVGDFAAPFLLHEVNPADSLKDDMFTSRIDPKMDIDNGPHPVACEVTSLVANNVWRVEFEVKWTVAAWCPVFKNGTGQSELDPNKPLQDQFNATGGLLPNPDDLSASRAFGVRSHTWTCHEEINSNFFTTRTYNGELKLSNPNFNPLDFRYLCRPPLAPGARRKSISYRPSDDKLTLQYTITDEEIVTAAPGRYTELAINHTEMAEHFGATIKVNLDVTLSGDRFANRFEMLSYVCAIVDFKLQIKAQANGANFGFLADRVELATAEGTNQENYVRVKVSGERVIDKNKGANLLHNRINNGKNVVWFGFMNDRQFTRLPNNTFAAVPNSPPYDSSLSRGGNNDGAGWTKPDVSGGLSLATAWHAYVVEPCQSEMSFIDTSDMKPNDTARRGLMTSEINSEAVENWNYVPEVIIAPDAPLAPFFTLAGFSTSHDTALYTTYRITSHYDINGMSVSMPAAQTTSTNPYVTSPGTAFCRLSTNQWRRKIFIEAERYGAPPRIPTLDDTYTEARKNPAFSSDVVTGKLIKAKVSPCAPQPVINQAGYLYSMNAEYEYALNGEPKNLKLGIPDFDSSVSATDPASVPAFTVESGAILNNYTWGVEV